MEEEVVFFLLQKTAPHHEIRAAFAPPGLRGWVYLEATMNGQLRSLLNLTPGVVRTRLDCQGITHEDGMKLLQMRQFPLQEYVGNWVQVRKGLYKGDVGYVHSAGSWDIRLFLIPRLPPPQDTSVSCPKRKRTCLRSAPALFDPGSIRHHYDVVPDRLMENIYTFGGNTFEYGLIVKLYDFYSVSTTVSSVPLVLFNSFFESQHPELLKALSTIPRPSEWHFAEGDEVYYLSDFDKKGIIKTLRAESAEVATSGDSVVSASWMHIHKVIRVSDFVKVTGGVHQGREGWVTGVVEDAILRHAVTIVLNNDEANKSLSNTEVGELLGFKGSPMYCARFRQSRPMLIYWCTPTCLSCLVSLVLQLLFHGLSRSRGSIQQLSSLLQIIPSGLIEESSKISFVISQQAADSGL